MNPFALIKRSAKVPVAPALLAAASGQRPIAPGDVWMGAGQPFIPQEPQVAGRQFDFAFGENMRYTPRATEGISFAQLRTLATSYDLLHLLIETRKDQLVKFEWQVAPIDDETAPDSRCKTITQFLKFPDRKHNWQTWLRALVDEMLVTDAACVYPVLTRGGGLYSLEWFDGTTIKPLIDDNSGHTPAPPDPAYQQILKGIPAVDYTADELIYAPRNQRVWKLYGCSPVEQIVMTVNIALRRQMSQLQAYTEGNIPELIIGVPETWSPKQTADFQAYWDALLEGNTAARRHAKFVPGGMQFHDPKSELLKDPFDEWLARVCCYAFSLPPSPFVRDQNRSTTESAKEAAIEEGLVPLMAWIKDMMDLVIRKYFGYGDLEFQWQEEEAIDPLEAAKIQDIKLRNGVLSIDEARQDDGREGIGMSNAIYNGTGAILVEDIINPPDIPAPTQVIAQEQVNTTAEGNNDKDAAKFEKAWASPTINVTLPPITLPAMPAIHMRAPDVLVEAPHIHVDVAAPILPKAPDVKVEIGPTTLHVEQPTAKSDKPMLHYEAVAKRNGKNELVAELRPNLTKTAKLDADGNLTITSGEPDA